MEKAENSSKRQKGNVNNNNENTHSGNHRNCLTCRLLNKLQMGLGDCEKCKDSSKPCRCQQGGKLPASIRREIEDYEVPWPEKIEDDWQRIERRKTSGNKAATEEIQGEKIKGGNQNEERKEGRNEWELPRKNRVSSKVRFQRVSVSSPSEEEKISSSVRKSASYTIDRESETADSLLDKPEWMQYKNAN